MKVKFFSRIKHELLYSYVPTWLAITRQRGRSAKYYNQYIIDGYCGDGIAEYEDGAVNYGSALIFADLLKKTDKLKLILNDFDKKLIIKLEEKLKQDFPNNENITIHNKDFNLIIDDIIEKIGKNISIFLLDPKGVKSLPWKTVEKIGLRSKRLIEDSCKGGRTEIFINYMQYAIDRNAGFGKPVMDSFDNLTKYLKIKVRDKDIFGSDYIDEDKNQRGKNRREHNDNFFGTREWRDLWDKGKNAEERREKLLELYKNNLKQYFETVLVMPVKVKNRPLYYMIYATNNTAGRDVVQKKIEKLIAGKYTIRKRDKLRNYLYLDKFFNR